MRIQGRIRPGRTAASLAILFGIALAGLGFVVIGPLDIWTGSVLILFGAGVFLFGLVNLVSARGLAHGVIEFDSPPHETPAEQRAEDHEARLRRLADLREKGLVDEREYDQQRSRILDEL